MVGNWLCHIPTLHHYDRFPPGGNTTGGNMLGNHHHQHHHHHHHHHHHPDVGSNSDFADTVWTVKNPSSVWVESWLISICSVLPSLLYPLLISGVPKVEIIIPWLFIGWRFFWRKKRTDQIWLPQLPVNSGRRLFHHSIKWTVRRWFQGHVFKRLTLGFWPYIHKNHLRPTKFKNTV